MKRLFKLGLLALMGVCGFVGISRADDPEDPTTTATSLPTPTFTPNSGTLTQGDTITFTIPTGYENAQVFVFYVFNDETATLETTYEDLLDDFGTFSNLSFRVAMNTYGASAMSDDEEEGEERWVMPCIVPSNVTGNVTFRARMATFVGVEGAGDPDIIYSDYVSATFTVEAGEAETIPVPSFNPEGGEVAFATSVQIGENIEDMGPTALAQYIAYWVVDNADFNFSQYTDVDEAEAAGAKYTASYKIVKNTTIKAATVKLSQDGVAWSEPVSATYTVTAPNAPEFDIAAGAVKSGTKVTIKSKHNPTLGGPIVKIYYTTDGTVPTKESTEYTDSIEITEAMTIKAIAVGIADNTLVSTPAEAAYTIKADDDPDEPTTGAFTITPEATETAMDAGTKLTLAYSGEHDVIYYAWFVDEATAKAAEFVGGDPWGMYQTPNFVPELTAAKPVLKVVALDDEEEVIADSVVVYVVKAAPVEPTTIDVTFDPVSGSKVAPGAKISVEIAELGEGEELNYKWFASKEDAEAAEWAMDWNTDQPEAYLERGLKKDTLYLKVALVEVDEEWNGTVKGYGLASYIVDIELMDKIVVTPANGTLVRENDSVTIEVKFGGEATEGTLVYKWYASVDDANAEMDFMTTAQTYNAAIKPVITKENRVLMVGYKNAEAWVIEPVTVEYFFTPSVTGFTVEAAGKNEMKENTVVFDGMASFKMNVDGDVVNGLKIAAKIYSKDYSDTITTDSYEATDTLAQFVGIYNGEYVVNFSLRHAYAADKDSAIVDTTIFFNVTNYEEPVVVNPELTVKAVGAAEGEEVVFNTKNVAFDMFVKSMAENDTLVVTIYTKVEYDSMKVVDPRMRAKAADSARFEATLEYGEYVAMFEIVRKSDKVGETVVADATISFSVREESAIERNELAGVNVYPNPNAGTFNVAVPEHARVEIFGLNGAKVMSREVNAGVESFNIDHSGIYFVRVMAGNKTAVKRVVVR